MTSFAHAEISSSGSIQTDINNAARRKGLFMFIEKAKEAQEIAPETAELAWSTWNLLSRTLAQTLMVPDASCGPDDQMLFLWDKDEHHLGLEIEATGNGYFFYRNRASGALWDMDYTPGNALSSDVVEKLRMFA